MGPAGRLGGSTGVVEEGGAAGVPGGFPPGAGEAGTGSGPLAAEGTAGLADAGGVGRGAARGSREARWGGVGATFGGCKLTFMWAIIRVQANSASGRRYALESRLRKWCRAPGSTRLSNGNPYLRAASRSNKREGAATLSSAP